MLYDLSNTEAAATTCVLRKMLVPIFAHDTAKVPMALESEVIPSETQTVCVLCTHGIFENPSVLKLLTKLPEHCPNMLPVICEQAFRFPSRHMSHHLQGSLPVGMGMQDANIIGMVVHALFKEIAINFVAQHAGEANLRLSAEDVAKRLDTQGRTSTLQLHNSMNMILRKASSASNSTGKGDSPRPESGK
eukprot:4867022-Amphidinium_carterae.1